MCWNIRCWTRFDFERLSFLNSLSWQTPLINSFFRFEKYFVAVMFFE
jgi:hypothetical protein